MKSRPNVVNSETRHGKVGLFRVAVLCVAALFASVNFGAEARSITGKLSSGNDNQTVVILGASYAKGWKIQELFGLRVLNKGAGGEQTHELLARFEHDVVSNHPKAVVMWGFINDLFRTKPGLLAAKLPQTKDNILAMIEKSQRAGIVPILVTEVTMPVPDNWREVIAGWVGKLRGKQSYQDFINGHVREINEWLRVVAKQKNIAVLDFERILADGKSGNRKNEYATEDGTHLSPQAYEVLTAYATRTNFGL